MLCCGTNILRLEPPFTSAGFSVRGHQGGEEGIQGGAVVDLVVGEGEEEGLAGVGAVGGEGAVAGHGAGVAVGGSVFGDGDDAEAVFPGWGGGHFGEGVG